MEVLTRTVIEAFPGTIEALPTTKGALTRTIEVLIKSTALGTFKAIETIIMTHETAKTAFWTTEKSI